MSAPTEVTTGLRSILSMAPVYRFAQRTIGADRFRSILVSQIIRPTNSERVLDVGAGTGDILDWLPPSVDYVGFDPSPAYVAAARNRFGARGRFETSRVEDFADHTIADRSIVMAIGVLHHLDDNGVRDVLRLATQTLSKNGRFISVDPTLTEPQHPVARFLVSRDRGQHVREPAALAKLVDEYLPDNNVSVRHDLLRTPYSHVIVEARSS